jgi:hypothetical protein
MENSSWHTPTPDPNTITYFDAGANGIKPTLYTVESIVDTSATANNGKVARRVFKYNTATVIDFNNLPPSKVLNLQFSPGPGQNWREYVDAFLTFPNNTPAWSFDSVISSTTSPDAFVWTPDTDYNDTPEPVYINWAFNSDTAATITNPANDVPDTLMPYALFDVTASEQKWTLIKLLPFLSFKNQFGVPVATIGWDGALNTAAIVTRSYNESPGTNIHTVLTSNTHNVAQFGTFNYPRSMA